MTSPPRIGNGPDKQHDTTWQLFALSVALPLVSLALAWLTSLAIDGMEQPIGPIDRAVAGWAITIPLAIASPGVAAALIPLFRPSGVGWFALAIVAVVVAAAVTGMLATSIESIGTCSPVTDDAVIFSASLQVGLASGVAFVASTIAGISVVGRLVGGPGSLLRATIGRFVAGAIFGFGGFMLTVFIFARLVWNGGACAPS